MLLWHSTSKEIVWNNAFTLLKVNVHTSRQISQIWKNAPYLLHFKSAWKWCLSIIKRETANLNVLLRLKTKLYDWSIKICIWNNTMKIVQNAINGLKSPWCTGWCSVNCLVHLHVMKFKNLYAPTFPNSFLWLGACETMLIIKYLLIETYHSSLPSNPSHTVI